MDIRLIKKIITLVEESQIHELEVEEGDLRISVRKESTTIHYAHSAPPQAHSIPIQSPTPSQTSAGAETSAVSVAPSAPVEAEGVVIPSPMVGTFYRSSSPEAPAFVQVGSEVEEDSVVCILEAMKVMNEIKSGVRGKVVEILVENGSPVEFGQPLFRVKN